MYDFERVLWIRGKNERESRKPTVVGIVGDRMHWHCGMTRCTWMPDEYVIVREYAPEDQDKALDDLEKEYAPKPVAPCARLGWISPEGHFYPCGYCCHSDLESILGEQLYDSGCWPRLTEKGWIELKSGALIGRKEGLVTQEAKNTMRKIVEEFELEEAKNPNINWTPILWDNPEGYSEQPGWSDPAGDLIRGETYAKALRSCYELYFGEGDEEVGTLTPPSFGDNIRVRRPGEHPGD